MTRLTRYELIAVLGGLLLGGAIFAPWYDAVSRLATIDSYAGVGAHSGWRSPPSALYSMSASVDRPGEPPGRSS